MAKIILITGSSTGIGAETAKMLAAGNQVVVHYNSSQVQAEKVAAAVNESGGKSYLIQADVASETGCKKLADFVQTQFGKLDILINNAGGLDKRHSTQEISWGLLEKTFALNAFSAMLLSSLCIPLLKQGTHPAIVNITSLAIRTGAPMASIYAAAKGAIDVFTRGLAKELAPQIRVNAIAPGYIQTPFHDGLSSKEQIQTIIDATPLKMTGESQHVAMAVKMLVENDFMTGETIDVNGGLFMR